MSSSPDGFEREGPLAPPRSNGELVFQAPWESRAFGLAVALHRAGLVGFEDFRARLVDEIGASDGPAGDRRYYESWERALERTLAERGLVAPSELDARAQALGGERARDHRH